MLTYIKPYLIFLLIDLAFLLNLVTAQYGNCVEEFRHQQAPLKGTGVQLNGYTYCAGTLNVTAYVENVSYNKLVKLYYSNIKGDVTPLSVLSLGYASDVANAPGWEYWFASAPYTNLDGIQQLVNVTFQATDIPKTYSESLNCDVVSSGPVPTTSSIPAPYASPTGTAQDITDYFATNADSYAGFSKSAMFKNINIPGAANGTVIAAQSYSAPDYAYDWVRDSSLTMDVVEQLYQASKTDKKSDYQSILFAYAKSRALQQNDPNLQTGLGEPKFNLNNTVFTGPWGRPQNDGPATSSITLINFANAYLAAGGDIEDIRRSIYDSSANPMIAPVKKDLLFVANNWTSPSFDAWEEVESDHFYTKMVQHRALSLGVDFANKLGDDSTSKTLSNALSALESSLAQFWDDNRQQILYAYGPVALNKYSYKDIAVLLGVNHGYNGDNVYSFTNDKVLATAVRIATCFIPVFGISSAHSTSDGLTLAPPIGRYPEDVYNGVSSSLGNPWYMTTATVAEYLYRTALFFNMAGSITVSDVSKPFWDYFAAGTPVQSGETIASGDPKFAPLVDALRGWGDAFMRTVKHYTPDDKSLAEEYDRSSGMPQGAADLTWSYASVLTAGFARADMLGDGEWRQALADL